MKRKMRLLIGLFCVSIYSYGQTELGIGVVAINFNDTTLLNFYLTPTNKEPEKTLEFFNDTSINSWNIRNLDKQREWLRPEVLWLDYSLLFFRCKSEKNGWFQLIVNNDNGKTYWLKKTELTNLSTWETYLKEMFGVARLADRTQVIRKSPSDTSEEIKYTGEDCFQVKSMQGDWIEIFSPTYCVNGYTDSKTKIKSGWIKWRQGNNLLIEFFITS